MMVLSHSVGAPSPFQLPSSEGAVSDFLGDTNRLLIRMDGITDDEAWIFNHGDMYCSMLVENGGIMFLFVFLDKNKKPYFTFDCPFNAKAMPDINIPDMTDPRARLVVDICVVDGATNIVRVIRANSLTPRMSREFIEAASTQLTSPLNADEQAYKWLSVPFNDLLLASNHKPELMGQ